MPTLTLIDGSGFVFRAVSPERLINTVSSLLVFSSWAIVADVVLAAGCGEGKPAGGAFAGQKPAGGAKASILEATCRILDLRDTVGHQLL